MATPKGRRVARCGLYEYYPDDPMGRGSFADVFHGVHIDGSNVAIKRISKRKFSNVESQRFLQSEISILESLRHPNIVQLFSYQETAEYFFLIMEYCEGGDLNAYIKRTGTMTEEHIALLLQQLVDALNFLNSKSVVHRDLKPQNILLRESGGPVPLLKIADFGFARLLEQQDMTMTYCGTPFYMAPEVLDHKQYNSSVDLFSLGAIIYQCYTGEPPYRASNVPALVEIHHTKNLPPISSSASPAFKEVLLSLLQIDPKQRMTLMQLTEHPFLPRNRSKADSAIVMQEEDPTLVAREVDDRSFVMIDPHFAEVNILADSVERRMRMADPNGRNPEELVGLLEKIVNGANLIVSLANECLQSQPESMLVASIFTPSSQAQAHGEALALFAKALAMLRSGLSNLRGLVCRTSITVTPALYGAVQNLRQKFNECVARIETIRSELSPASMRGVRTSAEQLLYNHALSLSREAAKSEACGNYSSSEVGYNRAMAFLRLVLLEAQGQAQINVESILESLSRRRDVVGRRRAEQEAHRVQRRQLTGPLDESAEGDFGAPTALPGSSHQSRGPPSTPITISSRQVRHQSLRSSTSPSDLKGLEQVLASSAPALTDSPRTSPGTSPSARKIAAVAAFCGNCGSPFNSQNQRFCTGCGTQRVGMDSSSTMRIPSSS